MAVVVVVVVVWNKATAIVLLLRNLTLNEREI